MHTVFALLCFVVVIHWLTFPYPSGLLHWHCDNLTIAPVPAKQPWWIWINTSCEFIMNDCITTTTQSTTKPCAYVLGYTVGITQGLATSGTRDPSQYTKIRLSVRSRKVSKPRDLYLELSDRSEIWRALRQHCCRCACQISKLYDNLKYQSRGFETSRDLTKRRLFGYWDGAQLVHNGYNLYGHVVLFGCRCTGRNVTMWILVCRAVHLQGKTENCRSSGVLYFSRRAIFQISRGAEGLQWGLITLTIACSLYNQNKQW